MATYRAEGKAVDVHLTDALAAALGCGDTLDPGDIVVINNLVMVVKNEVKKNDEASGIGAGHVVGVYNLCAAEIDDVADTGDLDQGEEVFVDDSADNVYTTGDDVPTDIYFGLVAADGTTAGGVDVILKQRGEVVMET